MDVCENNIFSVLFYMKFEAANLLILFWVTMTGQAKFKVLKVVEIIGNTTSEIMIYGICPDEVQKLFPAIHYNLLLFNV